MIQNLKEIIGAVFDECFLESPAERIHTKRIRARLITQVMYEATLEISCLSAKLLVRNLHVYH